MYSQLGQIFDLVLDGKNDKGQPGLYLIGSETTREAALKRLADLRKKELPGEFYLCVPWRSPANLKRVKCYGPRAIICENCKSEMRITGGNEALKTAWCPDCGSERVFARLGSAEVEECKNRKYIPGAFCAKKGDVCTLCDGSKPPENLRARFQNYKEVGYLEFELFGRAQEGRI